MQAGETGGGRCGSTVLGRPVLSVPNVVLYKSYPSVPADGYILIGRDLKIDLIFAYKSGVYVNGVFEIQHAALLRETVYNA